MSFVFSSPVRIQQVHDPETHIAAIRFQKLGKLYHFDYSQFPELNAGDHVIVETVRGLNMGEIAGFMERSANMNYKPITRIATPRDLLLNQQWQQKQLEMLILCREKASHRKMYNRVKFVAAEYTFDGSLLTFLYSSEDDNVDTRPLLQSLQKEVDVRIEFRQIGPRDVARIIGGQGACGGPRCCSTFLTEFSPISVKMAKVQGIPLNPTEITGMCGRLRCCLIYEYEQYVEARKQLPAHGKRVGTPHGEGKVIEVYPLRDGVDVRLDDGIRMFVPRAEIIPLEEFRALKDKAAVGCSKNEGGGCDCGARRPKSASGDLQSALDMAHSETTGVTDETETDSETDYHTFEGAEIVKMPEAKPRKRRPPRRRNKKRSSSRSSSNKSEKKDDKKSNQDSSSEGKSSRRKRRRRSRSRRKNQDKD